MFASSHRRLAALHHQLGQSLDSGIPLVDALEAAGPLQRERLALAARLRAGEPPDQVWRETGDWLPLADAELIVAGAASGRLPEACRRLAAQHELVGRLTLRAALASAYPLAVLHLGAVLVPVKELVLGSPWLYLRQVGAVLLPLWCVIGILAVVGARHAAARRRLLGVLPGFAAYQRARDLALLAQVLEAYTAAGLPVDAAWRAAGRVTGAPALQGLSERMAREAEAGRPPGRALPGELAVPADVARLYRNGEETGRLDENLAQVVRDQTERAGRILTQVSIWYPQAVFLGVAGWVAVKVISTYASYLNELLKMMES